jgi:transcriptional antiterminator NusG
MTEQSKAKRIFRLGDEVRIKSGPFASFTARIIGINQAKAMLKVLVNIFGRETAIELKYSDVD